MNIELDKNEMNKNEMNKNKIDDYFKLMDKFTSNSNYLSVGIIALVIGSDLFIKYLKKEKILEVKKSKAIK